MSQLADSAVGAILEIPPKALEDIDKAERAIKRLGMTSAEWAGKVRDHWEVVASHGLDQFIKKISEAQEALKGLGSSTSDVKLNTETATQQMSNFTEKVQSESSKVSASLQEIAQTPIDAKGVKEYAEAWNLTFKDVQDKIKALRNGLQVQNVGSEGGQVQLQAIKAWEDYYRSINKVNEESNKHARTVNELRGKISETQQAIDHENEAIARFSQKVQDAWTAVNAFKTTNPNFNIDKAEQQMESLRGKIQRLYEQLDGGGLSDKKENRITREIEQMKAQFATLDNTVTTARRVYRELAEAEDAYEQRANQGSNAIGRQGVALRDLRTSLQQAEQAQSAFNAELEKGNTAKSLASEYAKLTKRLQEVNDAMTKFQSAGGNVNSASYKALENEWMQIMARRKEIEKMNIAEVNQYRQQMAQSANQQDLSAFIQNEAQKTAETKRQADKRARYQQEQSAKYFASYKGALNYANAVMGDKVNRGIATNTYENRERAIKNLEAAIKSLNKADSDYEQKLKNLKTALNDLKNAQNEVKDAMKAPAKTTTIADANQARKIAEQTKTLKDYETAYKMLIEVMKQTPQGRAFDTMNRKALEMKTHIDEIKKKMGELNNQTSRTSNIMGQLQGRIAAAFSIGAITGFIKKMVEVRAQFELQRVALGAIIQDRDEANKIFTQIQNMALESPFNIMQLERATKNIAAFGFETKKLVPTMKMFADLGAGLGVELERITLVMGHLKARGFLEGTMVRQFTNMGFNVLGNLAKYYTELEGKMISVGEVQDRVKKKMISFEDVEEVLKRVTSAGGMFYDMQKKQSESLWGQLQRIQDAYDLMLNSIGQSNEGVIKSALVAIRSLINHWRLLAPIITSITAGMAIAFSVKAIMFMISGIKNLNAMLAATALRLKLVADSQKAASFASWGTGIGLVIGLLGTLAGVLVGVRMEQQALNNEIGRIEKEGVGNMYDLIFQYRRLADTLRDTNAPYEERRKAMEDMHRIFKDILPDQMMEIDNIRQMKDGYDEATRAIQTYYAEKIKTQQKEAVDESFGKKMTDEITDTAEQISRILSFNKQIVGDASRDAIKGAVRNVLNVVNEEIKNGETDRNQLHERFIELLASVFGVTTQEMSGRLHTQFAGDSNFLADYLSGIEDINQQIVDKYGEISSVGLAGITLASEQDRKDAQGAVDMYVALEKAVDAYKKALVALHEEQNKGNISGEISVQDGKVTAEKANDFGQSAIDALNLSIINLEKNMDGLGGEFSVTSEEINNALQSNVDRYIYLDKVNEQTFGDALKRWEAWGKEVKDNSFFQNFIETMNDKLREMTLSDEQKEIRNLIKTVGELNNVDLSKYKWALIESKDNVASVAKEVKAEVESLKTSIKKYETAVAAGLPAIIAQAFFLGGKTLEDIQQTLKAVDELSRKLGNSNKENRGKADAELKRWQDLKKAIESVQTAYEKARKSFTVEESNKMIEKRWGDVFKALKADIKDFYKDGVYDMEALTKAYQVLIDKAQKAATTDDRKKFLSELIASQKDTEIEIKVKLQEDSEKKLKADLDEMFANYEITEELKKLGVSVDLTYMVGGKPTTLEDIQKEIDRLKAEGGGSEDAENRIKILEEAQKKITQIELKAQKERLKNYEKYLKQMYSDRAKKMIEAYSTYYQMEEDFQKNIQTLESEMNAEGTTDARKEELSNLIKSLRTQADEAAKGIKDALEKELNALDWNQFKSSPIFSQMYQDMDTLGKKGIDALIEKLEDMRKKLQSASNVDMKAVREVTQYIEKLKEAKINLQPFKEMKTLMAEINKLRKEGITYEQALLNLINAQNTLDATTNEISDLEAIIGLKDKGMDLDKDSTQLTDKQKELYAEHKSDLQGALKLARDRVKAEQDAVDAAEKNVDTYNKAKKAIEAQIKKLEMLKDHVLSIVNSCFEIADALGGVVDDEWKNLTNSIVESTFQAIILTLQFQLMGIALNSAMGIIGYIAIALQVVASLLTAIFAAKDKRLQKKIEALQDRVDALSKSFEKLEKSIERALSIGNENRLTEQALDNLESQKQAYEEMIRLEDAKKKTDNDKIKEYKEKIEELAEAEEELYEKRHEKWGSTNDVWDEANNWVDAWLDAYKETGDGLDALNQSWDDFYENLVKKQAVSKVLGARMDKWIAKINDAIDSGADEYGMVDLYKTLGEEFKKEFGDANEALKKFFEYAGIGGGNGSLILSDLQKGIQNITEPQAAAIEAYLNSMRFAVFRHTEQLDTLIATIQMQYGSGAENPVVTELKGIRTVLDSINTKFDSIIGKNGINKAIRIVG